MSASNSNNLRTRFWMVQKLGDLWRRCQILRTSINMLNTWKCGLSRELVLENKEITICGVANMLGISSTSVQSENNLKSWIQRISFSITTTQLLTALCVNFYLQTKWLLFHTSPSLTRFMLCDSRLHETEGDIISLQFMPNQKTNFLHFKQCTSWNSLMLWSLGLLYKVPTRPLWRGQHSLQNECCYGEINLTEALV
jgi:hypothetical protein